MSVRLGLSLLLARWPRAKLINYVLFLFKWRQAVGRRPVPMLLIFGVFYLLLIRPQQKKQRQLQQPLPSWKAGDKVITSRWRYRRDHLPCVTRVFSFGALTRQSLRLPGDCAFGRCGATQKKKRSSDTDSGLWTIPKLEGPQAASLCHSVHEEKEFTPAIDYHAVITWSVFT